MKAIIKTLVKSLLRNLIYFGWKTRVGRYCGDEILRSAMMRTQFVQHRGVNFTFAVPNNLNRYRINTFSSKEPETLEWIDQIPYGAVVWDIGANVGLYTCYAAKARGCQVFAFEPSVFNLELLARNVFLNALAEKVTIVPLPLSDQLSVNTLNMTSLEWGGALSSFAQDYGQDGQALRKIFEFRTIGISISDAVERLKIPPPDYLKMDVDGIEHLILKGGAEVLRNVKGVLVEINDEFTKQRVDSAQYLRDAGLHLLEKRHAEMFESGTFKNCFNQIWQRSARV
jgi:FkbM family methyltransferase